MSQTGDRRLVVFLALSLVLHALWLALPLRTKTTGEAAMPVPLRVHLAPPGEEKSVVATRHPPRGGAATNARTPAPSAEIPVDTVPSAPPAIDLDAAFAAARSAGRAAPSRPSPDTPPRMQTTIESAIARATQADEVIETRGANGEYVTRTRHSRCVTPIYVPHFLEGKTMLTQCEALKG